MRLISRIVKRDQKSGRMIAIYPVFRISTAFLCILFCSLSRNALFTEIVLTGELCVLALLQPKQIENVLKTVLPAVLAAFLITCPAVFLGSTSTALTVSMKVMESVTVLGILNETCDWKEMTGSLQVLHVPGIVILTMDMTVNFLVILSRFSNAMLEAVSMRAIGDTSWKDSQIGGILGTTYLKSQHMADQTAEAMQCRGFDGDYKIYKTHQMNYLDYAYLAIPVFLIFLFLYAESLL